MTEQERLEQIKDQYSNAIDMALSDGETLPDYEMEVADVNFLIQQAEEKQKLHDHIQRIINIIEDESVTDEEKVESIINVNVLMMMK
ncbi:hypothetical protein KO561_05215 [Radiobacillus kanasensis]|uniref:hypothetical protein n=1 Tax=Radiobacillus kanasensis TaxID=2844358 RepID=UPI001E530994|nr:hypothetical protein [Radiobacillus kanasensis]UFU00350.1 hypothetical protein KO561_05215 [Radiobacillus kanasensis]